MAFALALQSAHDLPEGPGQTIFTATTAIVVLTVGIDLLFVGNLLFVRDPKFIHFVHFVLILTLLFWHPFQYIF